MPVFSTVVSMRGTLQARLHEGGFSMRFTAISFVRLCALILVYFGSAQAEEPSGARPAAAESERAQSPSFLLRPIPIEGDFLEGWRQTVSLDSALTRGESITLWVEDGWLAARRNSASGAVDWQVFLCPVNDIETPMMAVRDGLPYFEVTYSDGQYFIRDSDHVFRCRRLPKLGGTLIQKADMVSVDARARTSASSGISGLRFAGLADQGWFYVATGPDFKHWNAFVRLTPDAEGQGSGVQMSATGLSHWHHGDHWLVDDGELLVANRTLEALYLAQQKEEQATAKKP